MDDHSIAKLQDTLIHSAQTGKYLPPMKNHLPSIDDILETIEKDYKKLGDDIVSLKQRLSDSTELMNSASETILNLIRTMSK